MHVGQGGQLGAADVRHHELGAAGDGPLDQRAEHRVVLGDVRAGDEDDVARLLDLAHRARGRRGAEGAAHRGHGGRVAEPGAVVHVVGAEGAAHHPHEEVVVLVAALGGGEGRERAGAVLALDAEQLLRGEAHRLFPGGLAEGVVPLGGGAGAVAHVAVAHDREAGLRRLAHAALRRAGLLRAAHLLDGEPRPLAVPRRLARPAPRAAFLHPALPDQRDGQPVAVLREVGAEAPLHAGAPLVGGVLLDPGRRDADHLAVLHVQVHLAADAAVGADRPGDGVRMPDRLRAEPLAGNHLEDGAGGADADALAAPGAAGVVGVAVAADDDLGVGAPLADVEHAHLLDVVAGADAAGAEDAERHVVLDHHVARPGVSPPQPERLFRGQRHLVARDVLLELVARGRRVAVPLEVLQRIPLEEHAEHAAAILHGGRALRLDHHAVGRRRGAGGQQLPLALDGHEADAAVADGGELRVPAEGGDLDALRARRVEDGVALGDRHGLSVDCQRRHRLVRLARGGDGSSLRGFGSGGKAINVAFEMPGHRSLDPAQPPPSPGWCSRRWGWPWSPGSTLRPHPAAHLFLARFLLLLLRRRAQHPALHPTRGWTSVAGAAPARRSGDRSAGQPGHRAGAVPVDRRAIRLGRRCGGQRGGCPARCAGGGPLASARSLVAESGTGCGGPGGAASGSLGRRWCGRPSPAQPNGWWSGETPPMVTSRSGAHSLTRAFRESRFPPVASPTSPHCGPSSPRQTRRRSAPRSSPDRHHRRPSSCSRSRWAREMSLSDPAAGGTDAPGLSAARVDLGRVVEPLDGGERCHPRHRRGHGADQPDRHGEASAPCSRPRVTSGANRRSRSRPISTSARCSIGPPTAPCGGGWFPP